jgi:ankyrin repeat protein
MPRRLISCLVVGMWAFASELIRGRRMSGRAALQTRPFLDRGADIDAFNDKGQTSVHGAAALGSNSIVTFLAEHGARLTSRDKQGRTPLDVVLAGSRGETGRLEVHEDTAALLRRLVSEKETK